MTARRQGPVSSIFVVLTRRFAQAFSIWVSVASILALIHPPLFSWFITGKIAVGGTAVQFDGGFVSPGLQIIMLAMGLTLRPEDLRLVLARRKDVAIGVLLQFSLMPAMGWLSARLFGLPPALAAGLILVCCCPGGTASKVIVFLAKADVALSVAMTTVSTLLAAVCTPFLTTLILEQSVEIDVYALYMTTLQMVLLPVITGLMIRRYFSNLVERVLVVLPALAVAAIVFIVAGILAVQRDSIMSCGFPLLAAVTTAHGFAFLLAYVATRARGGCEQVAQTVSIEVGMQNSGLGVVLARASFLDPMVAVAPAVSAVVHCLYGSVLASKWGRAKQSGEAVSGARARRGSSGSIRSR